LISQSSSLHPPPPSTPTRRSSDLADHVECAYQVDHDDLLEQIQSVWAVPADSTRGRGYTGTTDQAEQGAECLGRLDGRRCIRFLDRKSTRLNSSHVKISYAVFCLK